MRQIRKLHVHVVSKSETTQVGRSGISALSRELSWLSLGRVESSQVGGPPRSNEYVSKISAMSIGTAARYWQLSGLKLQKVGWPQDKGRKIAKHVLRDFLNWTLTRSTKRAFFLSVRRLLVRTYVRLSVYVRPAVDRSIKSLILFSAKSTSYMYE